MISSFLIYEYKLDDGCSTMFWKDIWVGQSPLSESFPRLFGLSVSKEASVADHWNHKLVSWAMDFRRNFKEEEVTQWAALISILSSEQFNSS